MSPPHRYIYKYGRHSSALKWCCSVFSLPPSRFLKMAPSLRHALLYTLLAQMLLLLQAAIADQSPSPTPEQNPSQLKTHPTAQSSRGSVPTVVPPPPTSSSSESESSEIGEEFTAAEAPEIRRLGKHKSDKSEAGGDVIIGGLVTAIFAAVFCYIRITRKRGGVYWGGIQGPISCW